MPDESDERGDPDRSTGSGGDPDEPQPSPSDNGPESGSEADSHEAADASPDEARAGDSSDDSETERPEGDDAASDDRRTVETDGEGYAGEYVGEQLRQYKPSTPTQGGTHKKRKREREKNDDDWGGLSTPPDDEEMPLADHIEEMILRLAVVFLFGAAGTAIGLLWASDAIAFIWADVIPESSERPPHIYYPLELWMTRIKVSALLGIMVALPVFVYQCYLFMRPGLYPHERKYYLAAVPTSVVLAGLGMVFSYLVILPILFAYFTFYSRESAEIAYGLGDTFNLVITLTGFLAIVFQIPLFIMLAIMMGVTTRQWLADKRLYFWAGFAGLSFMFTFDPTFMAPVFVAITMIILFEGTLLLLRWTGR